MKDYEIQNVLPFIIDYLDNPSTDDESDCKGEEIYTNYLI